MNFAVPGGRFTLGEKTGERKCFINSFKMPEKITTTPMSPCEA